MLKVDPLKRVDIELQSRVEPDIKIRYLLICLLFVVAVVVVVFGVIRLNESVIRLKNVVIRIKTAAIIVKITIIWIIICHNCCVFFFLRMLLTRRSWLTFTRSFFLFDYHYYRAFGIRLFSSLDLNYSILLFPFFRRINFFLLFLIWFLNYF